MFSIHHYVIVCQWDVAFQWLSPGTPVSSTNKADRRDINEILFKEALNTMPISQNKNQQNKNHNTESENEEDEQHGSLKKNRNEPMWSLRESCSCNLYLYFLYVFKNVKCLPIIHVVGFVIHFPYTSVNLL